MTHFDPKTEEKRAKWMKIWGNDNRTLVRVSGLALSDTGVALAANRTPSC
jgi:hypothetical protein